MAGHCPRGVGKIANASRSTRGGFDRLEEQFRFWTSVGGQKNQNDSGKQGEKILHIGGKNQHLQHVSPPSTWRRMTSSSWPEFGGGRKQPETTQHWPRFWQQQAAVTDGDVEPVVVRERSTTTSTWVGKVMVREWQGCEHAVDEARASFWEASAISLKSSFWGGLSDVGLVLEIFWNRIFWNI